MENKATRQNHSLLPTFIIQYKRKMESFYCPNACGAFVAASYKLNTTHWSQSFVGED